MATQKKLRIVVRQWTPKKTPSISLETVREFLQAVHTKLESVLYVGWKRKTIERKRTVQLIAATGKTSLEARKNFKISEKIGENIWIIV